MGFYQSLSKCYKYKFETALHSSRLMLTVLGYTWSYLGTKANEDQGALEDSQ